VGPGGEDQVLRLVPEALFPSFSGVMNPIGRLGGVISSRIWGTTGSPWGYVRRLPPPTSESHIQPRYRDASTIRPEFDERDGTPPR
jgi:hypothetical protein